MSARKFCQSCTMPMDKPADYGTEQDGSLSDQYCKYCYQGGAFTDTEMTLDKMKTITVREMNKQNIPSAIIQQSIDMLPTLTRWKGATPD